MKKLILENRGGASSRTIEQQKEGLKALIEASETFGSHMIQEGLKSFSHGGAMKYSNCFVGYIETKTGSYALTLREYKQDTKYLEHKNEQTTVLLGWGFNAAVLTGDADISEWGHQGRYVIEDVPMAITNHLEETHISNYWSLDTLIKNFKETGVWDESLVEEESA